MEDTLRHIGLRQKLVEALRARGIAGAPVLAAMGRVPRHFFLDGALDRVAYEDRAVPIDAGQTISQPSTVAVQTELLQLQAGQRVLEVGTGSGYQAAVLCAMGAQLYSVERHGVLHQKAASTLAAMGYHPTLVLGDGFEGLPAHAPFDKIMLTCGAEQPPPALLRQLAVGGRMVIPMGSAAQLHMCTIDRLSEAEFRQTKYGRCAFVPLLRGVNH